MPDDQPILELETAGLIPDSNGDNHGKDPDEEGAILIKKLEQKEKRFVYSERLIILGSLVVLCLAILIVYVLHLILPASWRWLTEVEVDTIKNISLSLWWSDRDIGHKLFFEKMKIIF